MTATDTLIKLLPYLILAAATCFIWWTEHKDIHCPKLDATKEECEKYGGMAFSYTKPNDTDTCQELVGKIYKAAGAEQASVKWRKAFILSTAIMVVMWLVVGTGLCGSSSGCTMVGGLALPPWRVLYLSILVGYAVLLGSYLYYSFHVSKISEDWIKDSLREMEAKGCINNK